jgi:hypothetical protein
MLLISSFIIIIIIILPFSMVRFRLVVAFIALENFSLFRWFKLSL